MIKAVHGEIQAMWCDVFETHFLGKELANKVVHVLIGATPPESAGQVENWL